MRRSRNLLTVHSLVVSPRFHAVAAGFHVAPAAAVVLGSVDEEPRAVVRRAHAEMLEFVGEQKVGGGTRDWPQRGLEMNVHRCPLPRETVAAVHEAPVRHGFLQHQRQLLEGIPWNGAVFYDCRKDRE